MASSPKHWPQRPPFLGHISGFYRGQKCCSDRVQWGIQLPQILANRKRLGGPVSWAVGESLQCTDPGLLWVMDGEAQSPQKCGRGCSEWWTGKPSVLRSVGGAALSDGRGSPASSEVWAGLLWVMDREAQRPQKCGPVHPGVRDFALSPSPPPPRHAFEQFYFVQSPERSVSAH